MRYSDSKIIASLATAPVSVEDNDNYRAGDDDENDDNDSNSESFDRSSK